MNRFRGRGRGRNGNRNAVSPQDWFAGGQPGFWWVNHPDYLWQDAARTVPVTADGQTVYSRQLNTAFGPIYAEQSNAAKRPVYRLIGGLHWLQYDGTDDFMITGNVDFSAVSSIFSSIGINKLSDTAFALALALGDIATQDGAFALRAPNGSATANYGFNFRFQAVNYALSTPASYAAPSTVVLSATNNNTASVRTLRVNGAEVAINSTSQLSGNMANQPVSFGANNAGASRFNGRETCGILRGGALPDAALMLDIERWIALNSGLVI